jgi:NAD(P)-dependent dehydrogenase (short-subunit alcohol dehydrogenase family)
MDYIVITGVSTGIGYDAVRYLIDKGYHVFGSIRKQSDADRVKADFGDQFTPLIFDVTDENGVKSAAEQVKAVIGDKNLLALVNNAGISVMGPLMHIPLEDLRLQLEVNVVSVLSVTQAFLPLLGASKETQSAPGRIINISSVGGKIATPFLGAYAASKHALEGLSDSLRRELMLYGIDVILIEPGIVKTKILNKLGDQLSKFPGTDYSSMLENVGHMIEERDSYDAMSVEVISKTIHKIITSDSPKVRYALPIKWLSSWILPRFLPDRWVDSLVAKRYLIK